MITPSQIQKKDFTRGVRGYKEEEVDQFLDMIAVDIEALLLENAALKDSLKMLSQEIERFRGSESAILGTLEAAKALMADISASAEKRADIVLKNAELDAERIRRDARDSVEHMTEDAASLSRRWELFSARFRNLLETELERFNSLSAGLLLDAPATKNIDGGAAPVFGKPAPGSMMAVSPDKTFKSPKRQ